MAKNIMGSVGQGGTNVSQSVMTIQYLLNCVPAVQGGPPTELVVDGLIGPKTIAAILKFQKANLPVADGRVDSNGATLKSLQQFDPFPQIPYVVAGQKTTGLKLGGLPGEKFVPNTGVKSTGLPSYKTGGQGSGMPGYKSW